MFLEWFINGLETNFSFLKLAHIGANAYLLEGKQMSHETCTKDRWQITLSQNTCGSSTCFAVIRLLEGLQCK